MPTWSYVKSHTVRKCKQCPNYKLGNCYIPTEEATCLGLGYKTSFLREVRYHNRVPKWCPMIQECIE